MDTIEELLPGLDEFLTATLSSETLSAFAEERRQYFIDLLEIIKLPPTVPPREGRVLPPELLKETEATSGIPTNRRTSDFAATQREISRSFVESNSYHEEQGDEADAFSNKGVKVYDDIDTTDSTQVKTAVKQRLLSDIRPSQDSEDDSEDNQDNVLYEIPMARQQLSLDSNSLGADGLSNATGGSAEDLPDDVLDTTLVSSPTDPPPLPPRRDLKFSDSGSRNSINFDDKPPELPFRPPLPKRNELTPCLDKSDRSEKSACSDPELSGDGDSTSYESFDEDAAHHDLDLMNKLNIKLPKKPKKRSALKKSKKLSKSRSSSQWEICVPFRKLDNIEISGELFYRGKLKWNRRVVAISKGCLAMYKPDKEARPSLVIPLVGYETTVSEREGKKGFELKMVHPNADSHSFCVDFKDWANIWVEHINGSAKGDPPQKYHTHLARTFSGDFDCGTNNSFHGSKPAKTEDNFTDLDYDEVNCRGQLSEDVFIKGEGDCDSIKSSPVETLAQQRAKTLVARPFQSEKSPRHSKRSTLSHTYKGNPFGLSSRDKTISATVKDILRRRQRAVYTIHNPEPSMQQVERYIPQGDNPINKHNSPAEPEHPQTNLVRPASVMSVTGWDWKSVFYNWSMPLDQLILAFRGTDLNGSTSNVSTGSEGGSEDSTKSRGKGIMRMGSFAFRATQFFENIGKKATARQKSHRNATPGLRHSGSDYPDVRVGTIEEVPLSASQSTGDLTRSSSSQLSGSNLLLDHDSASSMFFQRQTSIGTDVGNLTDDPDDEDFAHITHRGYLSVFSSFNKRRWGKRWCLVRDNMFECYKSDLSKQCELNFLLKPCVLRRATAETNSENGLMITQAGREKITVEPLSKEDMGQWVQVLLAETSTQNVPEGLEEYLKDIKNGDGDNSSVMSFSVLKQWDMECLVPESSSHHYEDPVQCPFVAQAPISETTFQNNTNLNSGPNYNMSKNVLTSEDKTEDKTNSPAYSNKNKHTTDSGFYSAKGTNSDSDSSCEHSSRDVSETDFGYAAQDSRRFYKSEPSFSRVTSSYTTLSEKDYNQNLKCNDCSVSLASSSCDMPASDSSLGHTEHTLSASECFTTCSSSSQILCNGDTTVCQRHSSTDTLLNKSSSSMSSTQTILSPSGDEYSVVKKKSLRSSMLSESQGELNKSFSNSSDSKPRVNNIYDDDVFSESEDNFNINSVDNFSYAHTTAATTSDNESSFYEPICVLYAAESQTVQPNTNEMSKSGCSNPTLHQSSSSEDLDCPPPVPTSPIPDLVSLQFPADSTHPPAECVRNDGYQSLVSGAFDLEKHHMVSLNKAEGKITLSPDGDEAVDLPVQNPESPTSETISSAINNPGTTAAELRHLIDCLKLKQAAIRRKRIAVHDKLQKALSDEGRLACDKEFAALDRIAEKTNTDIRAVQSQLDVVQNLEAMKATKEKQKNGSKKRKTKRKP